jgi:hypothetical protein
MKRILALFLLATVAVHAATLIPAQVPASARWLLHADVERLRDTELGKALLAHLGQDADAGGKLDLLRTLFAFDPATDLLALTAYGTDRDFERAGAILMRVRLKEGGDTFIDKLRAASGTAPVEHGAHRIVVFGRQQGNAPADGTADAWVSLFDAQTLVMGKNVDAVKAALDTLAGKGEHLPAEGAAKWYPPAPQPMLFVSAPDLKALAPAGAAAGTDPGAMVAQNASALRFSLDETAGIARALLAVTAATPEAAAQMQMLAQGFIAMATLQAPPPPVAGQPAPPPDPRQELLIKLAKAVTFSTQGSTVEAGLRYPAAELVSQLRALSPQAQP